VVALAKLPYVIEHVKEIEGKVVIFAHHKSVVSKLKEALGNEAVLLVGDTKQSDRQVAVDEFQNNPSIKYFIGSIMAAGVGITLTASSNVVFAELDWVPGNITQAEDRCHRFGTIKNVLVQHLVLEGSLDSKMAKTLVQKQEVIDKALDLEYSLEEASLPEEIVLPSLEDFKKAAEEFSNEDKQELLVKLKVLAELDSDRASKANGVGFNRMDSAIGHSLASQMFLSDRQAVIAKILVNKYRNQL
jgi:SNF2 family DNA or RNA helicase